MDKTKLQELISYIINRGLETLRINTSGEHYMLDYVAVFAKHEDEFQLINSFVQSLGREVDTGNTKTGPTYLLSKPIETSAGIPRFVKVRKPDRVRPQRGAPDFTVPDYQAFKEKYIRSSGNFTLVLRKDFEMVEIKGVDCYVYIPEKPIAERLHL